MWTRTEFFLLHPRNIFYVDSLFRMRMQMSHYVLPVITINFPAPGTKPKVWVAFKLAKNFIISIKSKSYFIIFRGVVSVYEDGKLLGKSLISLRRFVEVSTLSKIRIFWIISSAHLVTCLLLQHVRRRINMILSLVYHWILKNNTKEDKIRIKTLS